MDGLWVTAVGRQLDAAIEALGNALDACPEELWGARMWHERSLSPAFAEFWYIAFHTLFWLDRYLSSSDEGFIPPEPFTLSEYDPAGLLPDKCYTKDELQAYLRHCRQKGRTVFAAMTEDKAQQKCTFPWGELSYAELLLDNMRHVQEHTAQLNMFLGQNTGAASRWVAQAKDTNSQFIE